jgi:hypothetical protein
MVKMIKLALVSQMFLYGGCAMLSSPQNAAKLSNPSLHFERNSRGVTFDAGSEFNGKLKGKYDATTGSFDIDTEVNSSPSPVIAAESERAQAMFQFYQVQAEAHKADMQAFASIINNAISAIPGVLGGINNQPSPPSSTPSLKEILDLLKEIKALNSKPTP